MEKVFHFDSDRSHYSADAAVLCCFDERIRTAVQKFLKKQGITRPDMILVAGGAKTLASPASDFERDFIVGQIGLSIKLHGTRRVLLMTHSDCGAYGGLAKFEADTKREAEYHEREMARAAALVRRAFPEVAVECYFVSFDGIWRASADEESAAAD
jgi:carbonic anhydrase